MRTVLEKVKNYTKEFKNTFGVPLEGFTDQRMAMIGVYSFDIGRFDDFMHKKGYTEEEHGSLRDYLSKRYGEKTAKLIEILIDIS